MISVGLDGCSQIRGILDGVIRAHGKKLIEGKFFCKGKLVDPGQQGNKPTSQSGSDKTGAATSLSAVNGALGLAAMAAVFLL